MSDLRTVNGLFVVENVCFPRSGHHMVYDVVRSYFGNRLSYCELYLQPERQIDLCPETNYQKNHDFGLDTPVAKDRKYLVQIRNPVHAITSRWAMESRTSASVAESGWETSAKEWAVYWAGFFSKWILSPIPNRIIVQYEDVLTNPMDTMTTIIQFIQGVQNIESDRLYQCLQRFPIVARRPKFLIPR